MPSTPVYNLPYHGANDPPNGPALGQQLATAVEGQLARIDAALATQPAVGRASSGAPQTGVGTTEAVSLTVTGMVFKAGRAYRASIRCSVYGAAGNQAMFRLRRTNTAGADLGEYGRARCEGTNQSQAAMVTGSIIVLRSAGTNLTTDVVLTVVCTTASGTVNLFASASSPRYLLIEEIGSAAAYAGLGADVT